MATAFAVFCATDGSLTFYNRDTVPAVGDTFEGKIVSNVYTGFDTKRYNSDSAIPWYNEMSNIINVSFIDAIYPIGTAFWFTSAQNMISFNGRNLNTSNVTRMECMFNNCNKLTDIDISSFDTSNVTTMNQMFYYCTNLITLDLSHFNTNNVIFMNEMFAYCSNLTSLDVSGFDTSNVTHMSNMFYYCSNLTSLDVSNFNTSKVTTINGMFGYCSNLTSLDVSNFNTSKVTSMNDMFYSCSNLTSLDVSGFDTSNVTMMRNMFYHCSNLTSLDVSNFDTSNVTTLYSMFYYCNKLTTLDLSSFNTNKVTNMYGMFYACKELTTLDLSNFDTSNTTNMCNMFANCKELTTLDLSSFNTNKVTNMNSMFRDCNILNIIYISEQWSTASVTNSTTMFHGCTSLVGAVPYDSTKTDASMANYETGYFTYKRYVKPEDMLIKNTTLYNIADEIRILYGTEDTMTPAVMTNNLNTFNTELSAINVEQDGLIEQLKNLFGIVTPEADTLDGCSWENISRIAEQGNASNFWSVGDTKKIVLNGTVGTLSLSNYETYVYIIGFDHNGASNTIDFGTFKTADGVDIAFVDAAHETSTTDGTLNFNINHWGERNYGGWAGCDLRYDILGSTDTAPSGYGAMAISGRVGYDSSSTCATNPVTNTLMAALPSELRAVMKPMTIYTDNVGNGTEGTEAKISSTIDYLPLLSEFEAMGTIAYANNSYEQNYQMQYAYYVSGNSRIKYRHDSVNARCAWWCRSVGGGVNTFSLIVINSTRYSVATSVGLAPIFRV